MEKFGIKTQDITIIEPLGYLHFLKLEAEARLLLTDSGGVQEEGCILGVPCVTFRDNTERPETIEVGSNVLTGANADIILKKSLEMLQSDQKWKNPYGDGNAAKYIIESIIRYKL
jgi:UDP-N-acetylglucosamine 2-epimerase (non-hydrolysing)